MDAMLPAFGQILSLQLGRTLAITGLASLWVAYSARGQMRRIYRVALAPGQSRAELKAGIAVLLFDAAVNTTFFHYGWIEKAEPSWLGSAITFALMFVWYEIWFYATHRLMHTRLLYWLHRRHHTARVTQPLTALSFSLGERAILLASALGFAAGVSQILPLNQPGLLLYVVTNFALNTLGHSNVETFPLGFVRSRWSRIAISPTWHAMHHARIKGHYGLFTPLLDRAFGTTFPDYAEVFASAVAGRGPSGLGRKFPAAHLSSRSESTQQGNQQ